MAEIGGKQLSTLLESLPGIASVLRSPVADAIVNMIRAGAGLDDFREADAKELVEYATRRGLLGVEEGDRLLDEIKVIGKGKKVGHKKTPGKKPSPAKRPSGKKQITPSKSTGDKKAKSKATHKSPVKAAKAKKAPAAKKATKKKVGKAKTKRSR